jgi:hypothetical protein
VTEQDARQVAQLALGRLFRIGSRPFQEGDVEEYARIRSIVLDCSEVIRSPALTDHSPN